MSHLRPMDAKTNKPKPLREYTADEASSALTQVLDEASRRQQNSLAIDKSLAADIVTIANRANRLDTVPADIQRIASGKDTKSN